MPGQFAPVVRSDKWPTLFFASTVLQKDEKSATDLPNENACLRTISSFVMVLT